MNAQTIAKRFDKPRREGSTWRFICPLCGKCKAWARDHGGKTYVGCFACGGDWRAIRAAAGGDGSRRSSSIERLESSERDAQRRDPLKIWRRAESVKGSPVETYLESRGLALPPHASASLRYAPELWHWPTRTAWPAMVALIADPYGLKISTHSTFLARGFRSKAPIERPRLIAAGAKIAGFGVWLGKHGLDSLIVAEGIETTLSAMMLYGARAGCAALSAAGLASLRLPPWIARIRICIDYDENATGLIAGRDAMRRWRAESRAVIVSEPAAIGSDFNDLLMQRVAEAQLEKAAQRETVH